MGEKLEIAAPAIGGNNLLNMATRVVGREEVIAQIERDVRDARLVSIVGPGGIGKTTVALAVAERKLNEFRDGVCLVDFAPLNDTALVPGAIAAAIGLVVHSAHVMPALCRYLRDDKALLVLDNCEHLVEEIAACAAQILREARHVHILCTSREPLRLDGERLHRLAGLATPPVDPPVSAENALTFPAIQLFVDRATDRLETFVLSDADAPVVAEICRNLDGIALAIELAAMRVDVFGVGGLHRQLDDRFRLLGGRRGGLERHRTVAATLEWSYGLLDETEAAMLRSVAVFPASFTAADAGAVAGVSAEGARATLAELASKSLLSSEVEGVAIQTAYRLLETTRAFSIAKLVAANDSKAVHRRFAEHVAAVLERAAQNWEGADGRRVADLRAALAWAGGAPENRALLIRLTLAGTVLWKHLSLTDESCSHLRRAIAELPAAGLVGHASEMQLQLALAGATLYTRGMVADAKGAMWRAHVLSLELDDRSVQLGCLLLIGTYQLFSGENDAGIRTLQSFVDIAATHDLAAVAEGETHLLCGEMFVGRLADVRQRIESTYARHVAEAQDDQSLRFLYDDTMTVMIVLAHAQWLTGSPDAARRTCDRLLQNAIEAGHELSLTIALGWASLCYLWSGDEEACGRYSQMLFDLVERHGITTYRPIATFCLAALASRHPQTLAQGVKDLEATVAECRAIGHIARLPYYIGVLAEARARGGRIEDARAAIDEALAMARSNKDGWSVPELIRIEASILALEGQHDAQEAHLISAIEKAVEIGGLSWRLRSAIDLARLWQGQSRQAEARPLLQTVYDAFTEGFETRDLVTARALLAEMR